MGLADREAKRAGHGVVASILHAQQAPPAASGKGRPKSKQEIKQRISLMILPSLYESAKRIAYVERRSVADVIAQCLEQYVRENWNKLDNYKGMKHDE